MAQFAVLSVAQYEKMIQTALHEVADGLAARRAQNRRPRPDSMTH
jgi:outer membrane protein TolC